MYTRGFGWADDATLLWYVLYIVGIIWENFVATISLSLGCLESKLTDQSRC